MVVGVNHFRHEEERNELGDVFRMNPEAVKTVVERYHHVKATRDNAAVERTLAALAAAAATDDVNLMPLLVDCCHAYATVGEMVDTLKREWGEFEEPVRL